MTEATGGAGATAAGQPQQWAMAPLVVSTARLNETRVAPPVCTASAIPRRSSREKTSSSRPSE
eukprot:scaffold6279_cov228-Isochrysis_galbana.AAC.5